MMKNKKTLGFFKRKNTDQNTEDFYNEEEFYDIEELYEEEELEDEEPYDSEEHEGEEPLYDNEDLYDEEEPYEDDTFYEEEESYEEDGEEASYEDETDVDDKSYDADAYEDDAFYEEESYEEDEEEASYEDETDVNDKSYDADAYEDDAFYEEESYEEDEDDSHEEGAYLVDYIAEDAVSADNGAEKSEEDTQKLYETSVYEVASYEAVTEELNPDVIEEYVQEYESEDEEYTQEPDDKDFDKTYCGDLYPAQDYAEDTESYYEDAEYENFEDDADYYESDEYYDDEYYDDDSFDTAYGEFDNHFHDDDFGSDGMLSDGKVVPFPERLKHWVRHMSAFDVILTCTGVVLVVAAVVILSMFMQNKKVNEQIEALAPIGSELTQMGVVGGDGLLAMSDAALLGNFAQEESTIEEISSIAVVEEENPQADNVNVSFTSVEKDLKIRFTDSKTGELITGTVFEVTLTSAKGKKLVLTDDDMDGIIYAKDVNPGVFDAIVTSTDKYTFPTTPQQVTVKDKVEYVVINVQDEVKTENQVNVAVEDTQKNDAAKEEEVLKDTVEWVESTQTPVSGSENFLLVDKNTIADPSQTSKAAARMLFDTLNVSLDKANVTMNVGAAAELKGTTFTDSKEGDIEYKYTTEWTSSDESVATVNSGKVTAKAAGTTIITYTVTKKTITTTYESKDPVEETLEIPVEEYESLSDEEKAKCTPIKDAADQIIGYTYNKVTQPEKKTEETTETASAECVVTVEAAKIVSGSLELSKSAEQCAVGETLTVKPAKLVYTKDDGSKETITENFPDITWESADNAIATVDADGEVTGVKAGKVHITGKVLGVKGADGKELSISSSVEVSITGGGVLSISLDRTKDVYISVGATTTLTATVSNYKSDAGVTWETSDKKVATVDEKGVVTGVAAGSATITATTKEKNAEGNTIKATCVVTVNSNVSSDTTTKLKDKNGNQIYIKNSDGNYQEAVYADYYNYAEFYIAAGVQYVYTGWQTIDGKTYFYDKNGNVVTGTQIIQGVTYNFGADGAIATTVNGSTFGIDVSRHNGNIDWNAVKASGVDYVIIRCGYRGSATGVLIQDENFIKNIKGASAAGLKVGIYVFSQAVNEVEAVKEASLAVSLAKGYNLTYPIFIDTESSGGRADKIDKATRTAVVNAFCQTVAAGGYKPGIYASKTWFEDKLNMGAIGNYKIWLAQYSAAPTYKGRYDMWQYSSKGKISGIKGNVDLNYSYLGY